MLDSLMLEHQKDFFPCAQEDITLVTANYHQFVRALPVSRGTALVWSHRLIHWGSTHGGAPSPRGRIP